MMTLGPLGFMQPWVLLALAALPLIWWLLRFTPPSPKVVEFPPTRLLKELKPTEETPARSPWWLTLLRMLLAALSVQFILDGLKAFGFAGGIAGAA